MGLGSISVAALLLTTATLISNSIIITHAATRFPANLPLNIVFLGTVEGKSFFAEMTPTRTWIDAKRFCEESNMRLASITSSAQATLLQNSKNVDYFLGWTAILLLVTCVLATDYCRPGICKKGKHICCGNPGKWGPKCRNPRIYPLSDSDKQFILDLHNENRQEVASGSVSRYAPAENMREVVWNEELANIACYNAITCVFAHDECRNTDDHPYAGQNLARVGQSSGYRDFRDAYEYLHNKWFQEHEYCDMHNIRNYQNRPTKPNEQIGHFTQLVSDKVNEVGCCVSNYEDGKIKYVHIVCNYSYSNISKQPIYIEGKPKCKKFSKRFKCLCAD